MSAETKPTPQKTARRRSSERRGYRPEIVWRWSHAEARCGALWDAGITVTIVGVCTDLPIKSRDAVWETREDARRANRKLAEMVAAKLHTDVPVAS